MRTTALFSAKTPDFSKSMVCPHGKGERGLSQFGHFADREESFFAILCGRPLWTAPNNNIMRFLCIRVIKNIST